MHLKLINGVPVEYTLGQLRRDNPLTSFPKNVSEDILASYGVYPYTRPQPPEHDDLALKLADGEFVQDEGGNWSRTWVVTERPLVEAESNIRYKRDLLLQETDWIVVKAYDQNQNIPAEWNVYRQALRDVTAQEGFPYSVTWPTKP